MKSYNCRRSLVISIGIIALAIGTAACKRDPQKLKLQFAANGDRYVLQHKFAEAVVEYRNAIVQDSQFGEARYKLAGTYLLLSDWRNALGESVRAADLMPDNIKAQLQAGKLLLLAGQYPEAKARADAALTLEPKNAEALVLMGNAMAGMKDLDGAIAQVETAIENDPRRTLTYANLGALEQARGNAPAAEAAFKRAIEVAPESPDAHLSLANYYWASNQRAEAEREFKFVLGIAPKSVIANRALASFYLTANRPSDAEPYLKAYTTLAQDPGSKAVLADFYLAQNKTQDAAAILEPMLQTKDGFIPAKLRLAAIDFAGNRRPQAYQALDEVFKREPKNEAALLEKGRFLMADRKASEALFLANTVVAANPKSAPGHYLKGIALEATGDSEEAIKSFQEVLKLSPSAVGVQLGVANLFLQRRDPVQAAQYLGQVIKRQPTLGIAHFLMGKALLRLGNLTGAEREIIALLAANPRSADVQTLLGDLQFAKKDLRRAREAYNRASEVPPGPIDALAGLVRVDLAENKKDAAWARLEPRLTASPDDRSLLLLAGATAMTTRNLARAEPVYRHVIELDPANTLAYANLLNIYMSQNRLDEALKEFQELERRPKAAVAAKTMMGTILEKQGRHDEASKLFKQAIELDGTAAVAANNLAWTLADGGNLDEALKFAQTAKAQLPQSWEVNDTLGWIYYKKGLASLAVTALREGIAQKPSEPTLHYHLGLAYLKNGDRVEAQKSLERALKLDPNFEAAEDAKQVLATIKG